MSDTLLLTRQDVLRELRLSDCVDAVERGLLRHARGESISPGLLGSHVERGGFHVRTAGFASARSGLGYFAAKVNADFPGNPAHLGLPAIQGVIAFFDAADGRLLALLDSIEITKLRAAAATAVAARLLAGSGGAVTICGCGEQSRSQLRALAYVRPLDGVMAYDSSPERAAGFAADMTAELGTDVTVIANPAEASRDTRVWVTCTPARRWFLGRRHVAPGSFVAAVGADGPGKQELEPALVASAAVVADILDQCATIGELQHVIPAGLMRREDIRGELADVVSGARPGRSRADEIVVFDSTGTALHDVAAAELVYERALASGAGRSVQLSA